MPFALPPWLDVTPQLFTSALQAGAHVGLALSEQQQRAQQLAEARAERESQQAEREREFDTSHLLNVQKVAQDAAQLQQQVAHQRAQESRLLDYDTGRLAVEKQKADLAAKIEGTAPTVVPPSGTTPGYTIDRHGTPHYFPESATPNAALDTTLVEAIDPATKQRVGLFGRSGPRTQHYIPDVREKDITPATRASIYNAEERGILKELDSLDMLAAARDPQNPKRARFEALTAELDAVRRRRSVLGGDAGLPALMPSATNALAVRVTRDKDGKLQWIK